mgnify:FL=1
MNSLFNTIKTKKELRKLFGVRELKIIEKQLWGFKLTQSEKNRLSRDIRKKFEAMKILAPFSDEFNLKKGHEINRIISETKEIILESKWKDKIKEIWLFGSAVKNEINFRSDIDIGVLFKGKIDNKEAAEFRIYISGRSHSKVDIQVFDVLPEKIKSSILKNHKVLYKNERK